MGGKLHNESVDRICVDAQGRIRFATRFGFYLLPGGVMMEIANAGTLNDLRHKMLEEHLEEEQVNLYLKAAAFYDQLSPQAFNGAVK
ncbi:MAG: hypothetical protein ACRCXC_11160 [Legionella sp.]